MCSAPARRALAIQCTYLVRNERLAYRRGSVRLPSLVRLVRTVSYTVLSELVGVGLGESRGLRACRATGLASFNVWLVVGELSIGVRLLGSVNTRVKVSKIASTKASGLPLWSDGP